MHTVHVGTSENGLQSNEKLSVLLRHIVAIEKPRPKLTLENLPSWDWVNEPSSFGGEMSLGEAEGCFGKELTEPQNRVTYGAVCEI